MSPGVESPASLWSGSPADALARVATGPQGLSAAEARARLKVHGLNALAEHRGPGVLRLLYAQVKSPLVLLLLFASIVSIAAGEWVDASMTMGIVIVSALL
ncbi:MAG: magnesium-translocating P-type ATPase, partial [Myxococcaceae bacterium]|nr:magnesium-translocating P-type ATPase [Myxococcaceae bacterium]